MEEELVALPPVLLHLVKDPFSNTIELSSYKEDYRNS